MPHILLYYYSDEMVLLKLVYMLKLVLKRKKYPYILSCNKCVFKKKQIHHPISTPPISLQIYVTEAVSKLHYRHW